MKKVLIIVGVIILALGIYLNRAYAHIYNKITAEKLGPPTTHTSFQFGSLDSPVTYVALGDSLTAGTGAQQYDEMFPYIVASDIAQKHKNVQYINYGTPGAKTIDVLDKQLFKTVDAAPDYVTVLIGVNDIHDRVSVDEFRANYDLIVKTLTTLTKAHVTVINIPYLGGRGLILPPYQWYFDTQTQKYNTVIEEIAGKYPVQFVDLYGETKDMFVADQSLYSSDLFHPSTKGYASWSNIILKDIK